MYDFPKKSLIIVRGLPGSGKSTIAHDLARTSGLRGYSIEICETDQFFMKDGKYEFDASKLHRYHTKNQDACWNAMKNDVDWVVVSNTSLTLSEVVPYIHSAVLSGYDVQVVTAKGNYESLHAVPLETIERMRRKTVPHDKFVGQVNNWIENFTPDSEEDE